MNMTGKPPSPESEDSSVKSEQKRWVKVLRWTVQIAVIGVIGFFLIRSVVRNWAAVVEGLTSEHFNYWVLAGSFLLLCCSILYMILLWRGLLSRLGGKIRLGTAVRIFSVSALGRYLPGKVWQVVGMVYLGKREGVRAEAGIWAAVLAQILHILGGALFTFAALLIEQDRLLAPLLERTGIQSISLWWMLLPLAAVLALLHPRILEKLTNFLLRFIKREPVRFELSWPGLLAYFAGYFSSWFLFGTAFWLFISAFTGEFALSDWVVVSGGFAAAYIVGLLAIFVPGGLGVREGLLVLFLLGLLGQGMAQTLSISQRVWFTAAELTFVAISLIFLRRQNGKKEKKDSTGKTG
ncbi:hypothetical protein GF359_00465 [candidate division WOR-3 bacterium]|uniref:Flippase-like domain-containing protein n=1 Tax=candidate division WOR-3 bacterium TaxID=2052148 RepID=A0A9D5K942_UNCW3|nr:hypothetical protein [candidate division WOR-3 bacterium]MBD3363666.1 hypothetical protein [candidate division WOR-3 bacterium]